MMLATQLAWGMQHETMSILGEMDNAEDAA
jgi:hypothetical protein